jgi:putative hemolysin
MVLEIILIIISIVLSAFFSSSEAAFLSIQKTKIFHMVNNKKKGADLVAKLLENKDKLISTIVVGNAIVNIGFAALLSALFFKITGDEIQTAFLTTLVGTIILVIFGDVLPKAIAVRLSESMTIIYSRPLRFLEIVFAPIVYLLTLILKGIDNTSNMNSKEASNSITEEELLTLIDIGEEEGSLEPQEAEMIENVFRFGDSQAQEIMTPRIEIISMSSQSTIKDYKDVYSEHSHSRFPIYEDSEDNIVGIISSKDILMSLSKKVVDDNTKLKELIREPYFVPETKRNFEIFNEMRNSGDKIAIIIDEYGGLSGVLTLRKLLEEVVGDFGEEGTEPEEELIEIDINTFNIDGGISIQDLNEELEDYDIEIPIPDGDYETAAGFVMQMLGRIPKNGDKIDFHNLVFEVKEIKGLKPELLQVTKKNNSISFSTNENKS